jgi:hypothetical protein
LISGFGIPAMLGVRAALAVVTEIQAFRAFRGTSPTKTGLRTGQIAKQAVDR